MERKKFAPIIYEVSWIAPAEIYCRTETQVQFEGIFPDDHNGQPIMKWIGLRIKNTKSIICSQKKSRNGMLFIEITPNTTIHALNCYDDKSANDDFWYQIYAGP